LKRRERKREKISRERWERREREREKISRERWERRQKRRNRRRRKKKFCSREMRDQWIQMNKSN